MEIGERFNPYQMFHGCYVPEWIAQRRELSQGSKLLYGRLIRFAGKNGKCNPRSDILSNELGVSRRQVVDYLKELKEHHLIEAERKGRGRSNNYFFLFHKWIVESNDVKNTSHQKDYDVKNTSHPDGKNASHPDGKNASHPYNRRESLEESHKKERTRVNGCPVPESLQKPEIVKAYQTYCQYMRENYNRWPTSTTTQMDLQKLVELQADGNDPVKVIQQTIQARNKSFYPLRDYEQNGKQPKPDDPDQIHLKNRAYKEL